MKNKKMNPLVFSMMWNTIVMKGEPCKDNGGKEYRGVRTMITPAGNRKLLSLVDGSSHVEMGKTIRSHWK
jgi:hypothetical protein